MTVSSRVVREVRGRSDSGEGRNGDGDTATNQSERLAQPANWGLKLRGGFFFFSGKDEFKSQHRGDVSQSDLSLQSRR